MKSWKTTTLGIVTILGAIATAITAVVDGDPATIPDWGLVFTAITAGVGLLAAKDGDLTGGTRKQ